MTSPRALYLLIAPLLALIAMMTTSSATSPAGPVAHAEARALLNATANAPLGAPSRYVEDAGHNLAGPFQAFYDANGGASIFGKPITEQLTEDGLIVQYFERARLELHPDGAMTLARLGALLTEGRTDMPFQKPAAVPSDRLLIPESGHSMGGVLRAFWEQEGGIALFGNPISEEFIEQVDGTPMLVQYFERVRLEYLPIGNGGDGKPRIGALGTLYAQRLPQEFRERARPIVVLGESHLSYAPQTPEGTNIELAAAQFDGLVVYPGYSLSYLGVVGEVSAATGYQGGQAVVGGAVVNDNIGGGICMVSTGLYRAAFYAGMEILSQRNHSLYLRAFQNDPGLDAAVFTPSLDMRWRNDSPFPITVTAAASGGKLVITLWGVSDGRKVVVSDPVYTNRTDPPAPEWRLDSSLGDGAVKWVSRGSGGMVITRTRAVTAPNGHLLHQDTVVSRYTPSTGLALYGPEVTPPGDAPTH